MSIVNPVRLDLVEEGLMTAMTAAFAGSSPPFITWTRQQVAFESVPAGGLVSLALAAGPAPFSVQKRRGSAVEAAASVPLTISTVTAGIRYGVEVNNHLYYTDSDGTSTATTLRDELIALIEGDDYVSVTASALSTDGFTLAADFLGGLMKLDEVGPIARGAPVSAGASVLVYEGSQAMTVRVETFSKDRTLRGGAAQMAAVAESAFQTESHVETLRRFGMSVGGKSSPIDLSFAIDGAWETRRGFDVILYTPGLWVDPVDTIDTATFTQTISAA